MENFPKTILHKLMSCPQQDIFISEEFEFLLTLVTLNLKMGRWKIWSTNNKFTRHDKAKMSRTIGNLFVFIWLLGIFIFFVIN